MSARNYAIPGLMRLDTPKADDDAVLINLPADGLRLSYLDTDGVMNETTVLHGDGVWRVLVAAIAAAHAATHRPDGNDPLTPEDIGAATAAQGTVALAAKAKTDLLTVTESTNLDEIRNQVAGLDSAIVLKGTWDASVGTFPGGGAALTGWLYIVATEGTVGGVLFRVDDRVVALADNASTTVYAGNWFHRKYHDDVTSVAGRTGVVLLTAADIAGLGGASILDVGTVAATVAAGDDSRFGTLNPGIYDDPAVVIDGGLL